MKERLQKILSSRGIASRRRAEEMISAGRVTVNGGIAVLGDSADSEQDEILVDGKPLPRGVEYVYILLNKPRGYVTTLSDEKGRPNAAQLVADCGIRVYPVGRLDMDSEGLLLFTNDGRFANRLMHPSHEISKTYCVTVKGFTHSRMRRLSEPMYLDGYRLQIPEITVAQEDGTKAILSIRIHEGRNRQVRRMCAIAGMQVTRLVRVAEGPVLLGDLASGRWRYLTSEELSKLK